MKIYLVGIGMGNSGLLTVAALSAIEASELVVGAGRLLEALEQFDPSGLEGKRLVEAVRSSEIVDEIEAASADGVETASVVFSGDLGFFSGSTLLAGRLDDHEVEPIPGISSLSYLCSRLQVAYGDAHVVSVHGRSANYVGAIRTHAKTFLLTGGDARVHDICAALASHGLGDVTVHAGERLSYPEERIVSGTAAELAAETFSDLAVMLVLNPSPLERPYSAPGLTDADFERGDAPMTKEEVRQLSVCKLGIRSDSVVWDVGAGTGSVTVEAALAASEGEVCAVERSQDALEVLKRNVERFGLSNVRVVEGSAPEALEGQPSPDAVFIGGSGGQMDAIVGMALDANPKARIVANAVTLETLSALMEIIAGIGADAQVVQVSIARASKVGSYHMMKAENPVYIVSFGGDGEGGSR